MYFLLRTPTRRQVALCLAMVAAVFAFTEIHENLRSKDKDEASVRYPVLEIVQEKESVQEIKRTQGNEPVQEMKPPPEKKKRAGLIIMGFSRSGTSYMDTIFNHDPEIFTVHEPLQIPNQWRSHQSDLDYESAMTDVIGAHMNCDFLKNNWTRQYLVDMGDYWRFRKQSHALSSQPFCTIPDMKESCTRLVDPGLVTKVCREKYKVSVIKICYERIPPRPVCKLGFVEQMVKNLEADDPGVDIKILNLVRDPRGLINSRINLGWIKDYPGPRLRDGANHVCGILETIINYGRDISSDMKTKYLELQYDHFFSDPVKMTEKLYEFAGFHETPEVVKEYVRQSTSPPEQVWEQTEKQWGSVIRNSTRNLERWKREGSKERNAIIEEACQNVFKLLNIKHWAWDPSSAASQ